MRTAYQFLICTLLAIAIAATCYGLQSKTSLGLLAKVINTVEKKFPETDWKRAGKGDPLFKTEHLRTGKKSVAIVKFTDKSMLRILENSELIMIGEKEQKNTINNLEIIQGTVGFSIIKQQNEQYTFTSPTSVASIRGTKGLMFTKEDMDILIVTEGIVNLKNKKSDKEVDVGAGEICFSYADGTIEVRKATEDELNSVENALRAGDERKQYELKFELKDSENNKKELKIQYQE